MKSKQEILNLHKKKILENILLDSINSTDNTFELLQQYGWYTKDDINKYLWIEDGYLYDSRVYTENSNPIQYQAITGWGLSSHSRIKFTRTRGR